MLANLWRALIVNQKIQLTVWDLEDENLEFHYDSYLIECDPPFVQVALPTQPQAREILPRLQVGVVLGAILEAYPAPYIFYPIVHSRQEASDSGFWLEIPDNTHIELMQRRRHVRISMILPIEVEYESGARWAIQKAYTEDLSGGGVRFTSPHQFYQKQNVVLRLHLNDGRELLRIKGQVVLSSENRIRRRSDDLYATACSFYDVDERKEALLMRECFRRELKKPL